MWIRAAACGILLALAACTGPAADGAFRQARLAVIPEGTKVDWVTFSRDGTVAAYIDRKKGEDRIVVNGKPGRAFSLV